MLKLATALMFGLTTTSAMAQSELKYFTTTLECLPTEEMFQYLSQDQGEIAFAVGDVWVYDTIDNAHVGSMLMSMNSVTGYWTMTATYPDGMSCVVAMGTMFSPPPTDQYQPQNENTPTTELKTLPERQM